MGRKLEFAWGFFVGLCFERWGFEEGKSRARKGKEGMVNDVHENFVAACPVH